MLHQRRNYKPTRWFILQFQAENVKPAILQQRFRDIDNPNVHSVKFGSKYTAAVFKVALFFIQRSNFEWWSNHILGFNLYAIEWNDVLCIYAIPLSDSTFNIPTIIWDEFFKTFSRWIKFSISTVYKFPFWTHRYWNPLRFLWKRFCNNHMKSKSCVCAIFSTFNNDVQSLEIIVQKRETMCLFCI